VYIGQIKGHGDNVLVKIHPSPSYDILKAESDAWNALILKMFSNIIKIYTTQIIHDNDVYKHYVVLQQQNNATLESVIEDRICSNCHWSESELYTAFSTLINAFANLERHDVAHCDISPFNIYYDS
jgi:serine/threonine protein kinase